jgi:hypothetical protein
MGIFSIPQLKTRCIAVMFEMAGFKIAAAQV